MRRVIVLLAAALAAVFFAGVARAGSTASPVEVVVTLDAPPLAESIQESRVLSARSKARRLDLRSPSSVDYLRTLVTAQSAVAARIVSTVPDARVTWRYDVVLNGMAVLIPRSELGRLARTPGVARVWPNVTYRPLLDRSPHLIGADLMWGAPSFSTAGNGIKIGIIDDGVDQAHPFFDPAAYTMPPGFPKGNTAFTTAKVIVARAFSPPTNTWKYAKTPFDPVESDHATHVAGIAAGEYSPGAIANRGPLSGIAPDAYIGNYKVLTVPTENFGLNGNAPEIAAGIEAAVRDGMDIINLSLGEPEIEPTRDLVVTAINAAADAGVVPVIAAGNEYQDYGRGSVGSPGSAAKAITAAAVTKQLVVANFSSGGPTPVSLLMKPDVSAPGVDITSSVPQHEGTWASFSGTSMAAPHVAGAAALLKQRHPDWTVAQIKSALVLTGKPVVLSLGGPEAPASREGGGIIDIPTANNPLIFAAPTDLSFRFVKPGSSATRTVELTDAGGGAGTWTASVIVQGNAPGTTVTAPATVTVPGAIGVTATASAAATQTDVTGFVVLKLGTATRRIPYWFRVAQPVLGTEPHLTLTTPGVYHGTTRGKPSRVTSYRYPDAPAEVHQTPGPEEVFRVTLKQPVANFGVVVTGGAKVQPVIVAPGDENRVQGYAALPLAINPYTDSFEEARPVAGVIRPAPGAFDVVFDTQSTDAAGPFTFRFWVDDVTPPSVRLVTPAVKRRSGLQLAVADAGSGVDPDSLTATVDGKSVDVTYSGGRALVPLPFVKPGAHRLVFSAADYEELKNMENVPQILPNTRVLRTTFRVG